MIKDKREARYYDSDRLILWLNSFLLLLIAVVTVYPIYFILIASFSDPNAINAGKTWLLPSDVSLEGYRRVLQDDLVLRGYLNSALYTLVGTAVNLAVTMSGAYALSRKDFFLRKPLMLCITFTMFFSGGMIPTFLVVRQLHLINSFWAMIFPVAVSTWNLIITRTFFSTTIPDELLEAATMDGCSNFRFFAQIVLPLSTTLIAILSLLYGVSHWNSYFNAILYIYKTEMYPLQLILRNVLIKNQVQVGMVDAYVDGMADQYRISEMIKYSIIVFACVPVMLIYPFIQRYFVKGVMIGSVKG